jgi:hypothetical protein
MTSKWPIVAVLVFVTLAIVGCSPEQSLERYLRRDIMAVAKDLGAEVSELGIGVTLNNVRIEDKAKGIQDKAFVQVEFLVRCDANDPWSPVRLRYEFARRNNEWAISETFSGSRLLYVHQVTQEEYADWGFPYELPGCSLHFDPSNWQEKTENRRLLEERSGALVGYRSHSDDDIIRDGWLTPRNAGRDSAKMLLLVGPSWPFVPERKRDLETWLGRPFTDEEIEAFRSDPAMESQIVAMIAEQESQGKLGYETRFTCGISSSLAEFFGMALSEEGRQVLKECAY